MLCADRGRAFQRANQLRRGELHISIDFELGRSESLIATSIAGVRQASDASVFVNSPLYILAQAFCVFHLSVFLSPSVLCADDVRFADSGANGANDRSQQHRRPNARGALGFRVPCTLSHVYCVFSFDKQVPRWRAGLLVVWLRIVVKCFNRRSRRSCLQLFAPISDLYPTAEKLKRDVRLLLSWVIQRCCALCYHNRFSAVWAGCLPEFWLCRIASLRTGVLFCPPCVLAESESLHVAFCFD